MDIENIIWNKNTYREFINYLISLNDNKYKEFHSKITDTELEIIGIRVPILKNISKKIKKTNVEDFFKLVGNNYYEEVFLYGAVLASCNEEIIDKYLLDFINRIDNWAVCDSFCSSLKLVNKKQGKYWIYFTNLIDLDKEFQTRVSIIIMMDYYLNDNYIDRVLKIVTRIESDKYYINMAISWLLSMAIIKYEDKVVSILKSKTLSKFVQKMNLPSDKVAILRYNGLYLASKNSIDDYKNETEEEICIASNEENLTQALNNYLLYTQSHQVVQSM